MRHFVIAAVTLVGLVACSASSDTVLPPSGVSDLQEIKSVEIEQEIDAKMVEVSGLGLRKHGGAIEVLAVGDRKRRIATADPAAAKLSFAVHDAPGSNKEESQWEAVAGDASGRIFALEENPGVIYVFDPEITKEEARIELEVHGKKWDADDGNSRGEGLVLLKNGHILLLKEKSPSEIVEFGPIGDRAAGYFVGNAVTVNDTFPVPPPGRRRYEVLKEWPIGDDSEKLAPDASDLAVGPDGLIYLLSDQGCSVSVIEQNLGPDEDHFKFDATWHLPKMSIDKPEGLVILPDGTPFIASDDQKAGKKNVFLISKLVRPHHK